MSVGGVGQTKQAISLDSDILYSKQFVWSMEKN